MKVRGEDITFALKVIKKKHVVDNRQEEHIHSERKILAEARSPFVVKSVLPARPPKPFPFFILHDEALLHYSGETVWCLLVFDEITVEALSRLHLLDGGERQGILRCALQKWSYLWWNMAAEAFLCCSWDYGDPISLCAVEQAHIKAILHHLRGSSRWPPHHRCIYLTFFRRFYYHLFIFLICFQDLRKGI